MRGLRDRRKMFEHRAITDEEKIEALEDALQEARVSSEDSDRIYDKIV